MDISTKPSLVADVVEALTTAGIEAFAVDEGDLGDATTARVRVATESGTEAHALHTAHAADPDATVSPTS